MVKLGHSFGKAECTISGVSEHFGLADGYSDITDYATLSKD